MNSQRLTSALRNPLAAAITLRNTVFNRLGKIIGHHDYVRFMIATHPRTGSNLLVSMLNSHPDIFCEHELFFSLTNQEMESRLHRALGKQAPWIRAAGFKIMYHHPKFGDGLGLWNSLAKRKDIRIIHLRRKNILRSILSREIARKENYWFRGKGDPYIPSHQKRIVLNEHELRKCFRLTRIWETIFLERFKDHLILEIWYEDLVSKQDNEILKVLEMLEVRNHNLFSHLRKQNPEPLNTLINNYKELKAHFTGSEWGTYFDE